MEVATINGSRLPLGGLEQVLSVIRGNEELRFPLEDREALAVAAHELRTPLATLLATVEILAEHLEDTGTEVLHLVGRLQNSLQWMNGLLDNLATWSAARDGQLILAEHPVPVQEWLTQITDILQPMLGRRGQQIRVTCPDPAPYVIGDALRLSQIVTNLITNASRYSVAGDVIEIDVAVQKDEVWIGVRDHGPGIPPDEQERLFECQFRGSDAAAVAPDGQGLGLHIVRHLVELHGGALGVESTPGQGSTFWFTLKQAGTQEIAA